MNFKAAAQYLFSLGNEVSAMKLGLENIRKLLAALGDPQNKYFKVQVAGTNGKGSVCAFLEAICLSAGIKTGLTTSPHLVSITERVRINGQNVSEEKFASLATRIRETAEKLIASGELETAPTYFEQVTAIALLAFAEANVELAILETGLGGRLDATTAANAEIGAITRIDFDHQKMLGETLAEIAAEKAAIIRSGMDVVVGEQESESMNVIIGQCAAAGVIPQLSQDVAAAGRTFTSSNARYANVRVGLLGRHQVENAKTAILLAEALQEHFTITTENIVIGLESARHPGRLEFQGRYLFDGAHNVGGAKALRAYLDEFVDKPITIVFGAMNDKDVRDIAAVLFLKADILVLTEPDNSRAMPAVEIGKLCSDAVGGEQVIETKSVRDALQKAEQLSKPDSIILVTGSLYLIGEAKKILNN